MSGDEGDQRLTKTKLHEDGEEGAKDSEPRLEAPVRCRLDLLDGLRKGVVVVLLAFLGHGCGGGGERVNKRVTEGARWGGYLGDESFAAFMYQ